MNVEYDKRRCAQIYAIEALGNSLTDAVCNGLDQACEAVDRIVEGALSGEKTADYHVIDIVLRCPEAELLGAEATT